MTGIGTFSGSAVNLGAEIGEPMTPTEFIKMSMEGLTPSIPAAYGWPADLADHEVPERLSAPNPARAAAGPRA